MWNEWKFICEDKKENGMVNWKERTLLEYREFERQWRDGDGERWG